MRACFYLLLATGLEWSGMVGAAQQQQQVRIDRLTPSEIALSMDTIAGTSYELLYAPRLMEGFFVIETFVSAGGTEQRTLDRAFYPGEAYFALAQAPFQAGSGRVTATVEAYGSGSPPPVIDTTKQHPAPGHSSVGWNEVAWDVDHSVALSLPQLRGRIEHADQRAADANVATNGSPTGAYNRKLDRYHFWPNVIHLSQVWYQAPDLYGTLVSALLDREDGANRLVMSNYLEQAIGVLQQRVVPGARLLHPGTGGRPGAVRGTLFGPDQPGRQDRAGSSEPWPGTGGTGGID